MKPTLIYIVLILSFSLQINAAEVTVKNDSIADNSSGSIQVGFAAGEQAASWLKAPCDGDIVGVQFLWRSLTGGSPVSIEDRIQISEAGNFPEPGLLLDEIIGPVLTDGVFNEFRFKDENQVIPLIVPVTTGNEYVVSLSFANSPSDFGPSVVTDADGCLAGKNGIFAIPPSVWFSSCILGVTGDFAIRAVVECEATPTTTDLSVTKTSVFDNYTPGEDVTYEIVVTNPGPSPANAVTVIDFFPNDLNAPSWVCSGQNGAICTNASGNGNITESINLGVNTSITFDAVATVDVNATDTISNTAQLVIPAGLTDTNPNNNNSTKDLPNIGNDLIFLNGFEIN